MSDDLDARITLLEKRTAVLADAVRSIAHGLEPHPGGDEPFEAAAERAARQAHELLLSAGL